MFDPYMDAQADRSWLGASVMKEMLCLDSYLFLYQDIFNVRKNKTKNKTKKQNKKKRWVGEVGGGGGGGRKGSGGADHRKEPFQGT